MNYHLEHFYALLPILKSVRNWSALVWFSVRDRGRAVCSFAGGFSVSAVHSPSETIPDLRTGIAIFFFFETEYN